MSTKRIITTRWLISAVSIVFFFSGAICLQAAYGESGSKSGILWRTLAEGIEYSSPVIAKTSITSQGMLHIVRISPAKARLRALTATVRDKRRRTAQAWCSEFGLTAVINAGMYDIDYLTHVGYMRSGGHLNNRHWNKKYNSILAFDPVKPGIAPARIFDLNSASSETDQYDTLIQNLRLIKGHAVNVWQEQPRRWSEAALAEDSRGRILFLFTEAQLSMYDFNRKILDLPLDIVRAMHLEGGPEASLSICTPTLQLHLPASYGTGAQEDQDVSSQWPLPNVIGVSTLH